MVSSSALIHALFAASRRYLICMIISYLLCKAEETLSLTNTLLVYNTNDKTNLHFR